MDTHLKEMGYRELVLIEGPDKRGIDVAFFSKHPLAEPAVFHDVNKGLSWGEITSLTNVMSTKLINPIVQIGTKRGFLEATFKMGLGKEVTFLANHWPSPANPSEERYEIAKIHHQLVSELAKKGKAIVSMGDFNTLDTDEPHGIREWLKNKRRSHYFVDAREEYMVEAGSNSNAQDLPGSHWYRGHYSALDKILILEEHMNQVEPDWLSFKTTAADFMMYPAERGPFEKRPMRFSFRTASGFSDHLPVSVDLNL